MSLLVQRVLSGVRPPSPLPQKKTRTVTPVKAVRNMSNLASSGTCQPGLARCGTGPQFAHLTRKQSLGMPFSFECQAKGCACKFPAYCRNGSLSTSTEIDPKGEMGVFRLGGGSGQAWLLYNPVGFPGQWCGQSCGHYVSLILFQFWPVWRL